jgi:hypothetical protein
MSPMLQRNIGFSLLGIASVVLIFWAATSGSMWTMTKIAVEKKDELFGTSFIEWQDGFRLGFEYTAAVIAPLILVGLIFLRNWRRSTVRQKK